MSSALIGYHTSAVHDIAFKKSKSNLRNCNYFPIENLVIRSEPFPAVSSSSPPPMITSCAAEERTASSTNPVELSNAVMKQPVTIDSSNDVKKITTEKKTTDDGDDPFGALDWKDGIATLPGNTFFRSTVTPSNIAGF